MLNRGVDNVAARFKTFRITSVITQLGASVTTIELKCSEINV